jgi:hypothetical protein
LLTRRKVLNPSGPSTNPSFKRCYCVVKRPGANIINYLRP